MPTSSMAQAAQQMNPSMTGQGISPTLSANFPQPTGSWGMGAGGGINGPNPPSPPQAGPGPQQPQQQSQSQWPMIAAALADAQKTQQQAQGQPVAPSHGAGGVQTQGGNNNLIPTLAQIAALVMGG